MRFSHFNTPLICGVSLWIGRLHFLITFIKKQ